MPETISIPVLRKAIENLRHQDAGLSSIDRCKLRCLEENLKVMLDLELASRVERIFCEYLSAAEFWQLRAEVACKVAGATVASNRACLNSTRAAISRSRKLLDVPRRA